MLNPYLFFFVFFPMLVYFFYRYADGLRSAIVPLHRKQETSVLSNEEPFIHSKCSGSVIG